MFPSFLPIAWHISNIDPSEEPKRYSSHYGSCSGQKVPGKGPVINTAACANSVDEFNENDMELAIINEYLDDLSTLESSYRKSTLANTFLHLQAYNMKAQVVKTILWQEEQMLRADELFDHHISRDLTTHYYSGWWSKKSHSKPQRRCWDYNTQPLPGHGHRSISQMHSSIWYTYSTKYNSPWFP